MLTLSASNRRNTDASAFWADRNNSQCVSSQIVWTSSVENVDYVNVEVIPCVRGHPRLPAGRLIPVFLLRLGPLDLRGYLGTLEERKK